MDARVAVLASGEGTNLQALLDDPVTGPWVTLVISDRAAAGALGRARAAEVDAIVVDGDLPTEDLDALLVATLIDRRIGVVALAGYMRLVGPVFVEAYRGRMVNVHPSLLPAFPGAHAVADALDYGVKVTGVTVHLVDEEVDHGPVIVQEAVAVRDDDDWETLEARIHEAEHRCLPLAVRAIVEGRVRVRGRSVRVEEAT